MLGTLGIPALDVCLARIRQYLKRGRKAAAVWEKRSEFLIVFLGQKMAERGATKM